MEAGSSRERASGLFVLVAEICGMMRQCDRNCSDPDCG
jgi:hypothetical protein